MKFSEKQREFIESDEKRLLIGARQSGKTECIVQVAKNTGHPILVRRKIDKKMMTDEYPTLDVLTIDEIGKPRGKYLVDKTERFIYLPLQK